MDLLLIARKIFRHKLVTLPIIAMTLCGAVYVLVVKAPVYEASSSYVLINPPAPPTPDQVARNPALGRVHADNPYTRFTDQGVIIDVLTRRLGSEMARRTLEKAGADPRYTVASGAGFGSSSPIVQVTGLGSSPAAAMQTANVVGHAVTGELDGMQREKKVDPTYRITALQVEVADSARLRASGQLRMLVGVLALGGILLFLVLSVTDALDKLLRQRRMARAPYATASDDLALLDPDLDFIEPHLRTNGHGDNVPTPDDPERAKL
jgi:hypothetical protein